MSCDRRNMIHEICAMPRKSLLANCLHPSFPSEKLRVLAQRNVLRRALFQALQKNADRWIVLVVTEIEVTLRKILRVLRVPLRTAHVMHTSALLCWLVGCVASSLAIQVPSWLARASELTTYLAI